MKKKQRGEIIFERRFLLGRPRIVKVISVSLLPLSSPSGFRELWHSGDGRREGGRGNKDGFTDFSSLASHQSPVLRTTIGQICVWRGERKTVQVYTGCPEEEDKYTFVLLRSPSFAFKSSSLILYRLSLCLSSKKVLLEASSFSPCDGYFFFSFVAPKTREDRK